MMQVTEKINHFGKQIEVIKSSLFVDTIKLSNKQSALAKQENKIETIVFSDDEYDDFLSGLITDL